uniref:SGNH/GDSL hydrolase family protein n=1 Tax=Alistipes sp. TaxID=1872444 RepID=UPI00405797EF
MKRLFTTIVLSLLVVSVAFAQKDLVSKLKFVDATELTMLGKLCQTTNPYHRVEVEAVEGITKSEANLLRTSSGLAIAFKTNATMIVVRAKYGPASRWSSAYPLTATTGFNLFIKDAKGEWTWAASKAHRIVPNRKNLELLSKPLVIMNGVVKGEKECILYLPLFAELTSLEIGVNKSADIEKLANPFRHNIAVVGSSFTHGVGASGAGLTWPAFLSRSTGLHLCSFGMSGMSRLQPHLADAFTKTNADAIICDSFSNPSIAQVQSRIRPFIEAIRKNKPDMPIIFINTIYREHRNFLPKYEKRESERIAHNENLMKTIVKEYKNVYFVNVPNQTGTDHITSADGTHPYSYGYHRWAQAIEKPIVKILKKHKIK